MRDDERSLEALIASIHAAAETPLRWMDGAPSRLEVKAWADALATWRQEQTHETNDGELAFERRLRQRDIDDVMAGAIAAVETWTIQTPPSYAQRTPFEQMQYRLWVAVKQQIESCRRPQPEDWHPMSTAPKDGTEVLLFTGTSREIGWWRGGGAIGDTWRDRSLHPIWPVPTHWIPLPDPPAVRRAPLQEEKDDPQ